MISWARGSLLVPCLYVKRKAFGEYLVEEWRCFAVQSQHLGSINVLIYWTRWTKGCRFLQLKSHIDCVSGKDSSWWIIKCVVSRETICSVWRMQTHYACSMTVHCRSLLRATTQDIATENEIPAYRFPQNTLRCRINESPLPIDQGAGKSVFVGIDFLQPAFSPETSGYKIVLISSIEDKRYVIVDRIFPLVHVLF